MTTTPLSTSPTSSASAIKLTTAEVNQCKKIISQEDGIRKQRATALLFIHQGNTYPAAGQESGLTIGQVRYLVGLFKRKGMELFATKTKVTSKEIVKVKTSLPAVINKEKAPTKKKKTNKKKKSKESNKKTKIEVKKNKKLKNTKKNKKKGKTKKKDKKAKK